MNDQVPGLQKSDKGRHDERTRHYKVGAREGQVSFSRNWSEPLGEEADLG